MTWLAVGGLQLAGEEQRLLAPANCLLHTADSLMPHLKEIPEIKRVYLIGICGTAMASLAGMLQQRGLRGLWFR